MSEITDVKVEETIKEEKKEVKNFNIKVNTEDGSVFTFSGPEGSSFQLLEDVAYSLLTNFVYNRIQAEVIAKAKAKEKLDASSVVKEGDILTGLESRASLK